MSGTVKAAKIESQNNNMTLLQRTKVVWTSSKNDEFRKQAFTRTKQSLHLQLTTAIVLSSELSH